MITKKLLLALASLALLLLAGAGAETTTVLLYMSGSDIQEDCVSNLADITFTELPDSVKVVAQVGGATEWTDPDLVPRAINRFRIEYESWQDFETLKNASMGAADTLADFLRWAYPTYPADRYILVLWGHGGGAADGVCFDDTANDDSLSISEIDEALGALCEAYPDAYFDIIGLDACLMATYEMAAHLSGYADYMVASEELEPYLGWNYAEWVGALAYDPDISTPDLCARIVDTYVSACLEDNEEDSVSMSAVYLPAMTQLTDAMEAYSGYLIEALENGELSTFSRARRRMYSFGSFDDASTDMVDFMAFLDATRQFAPRTAAVVEAAYEQAVRYSAGSDTFDYLTGMSILMPYESASDLAVGEIDYDCAACIPAYTEFVEGLSAMLCGGDYAFTERAPAQVSGGNAVSAGLQSASAIPSGSYVAREGESGVNAEDIYVDLPEVESTAQNIAGMIIGALMPTEEEEGDAFAIDEDSAYACFMALSQDELDNLSMVEGLLFLDASDDEAQCYIEMGAMQNAYINWETGEIASGFDGKWPALGDQLVVIYDQLVTSTIRRSLLPAQVNGVSGYLLLTFNAAHPEGVISGFTRGFTEHGIPSRGCEPLCEGDVVIPIYPMLYEDEYGDLAETTFEGDPITAGKGGAIPFEFCALEGGEIDYLYCFQLTDIYGEIQYSDFIDFTL